MDLSRLPPNARNPNEVREFVADATTAMVGFQTHVIETLRNCYNNGNIVSILDVVPPHCVQAAPRCVDCTRIDGDASVFHGEPGCAWRTGRKATGELCPTQQSRSQTIPALAPSPSTPPKPAAKRVRQTGKPSSVTKASDELKTALQLVSAPDSQRRRRHPARNTAAAPTHAVAAHTHTVEQPPSVSPTAPAGVRAESNSAAPPSRTSTRLLMRLKQAER